MAVYTRLSREAIEQLLQSYDLGALIAAEEIAEGVENTNYRLLTRIGGQQHRYILTIYEKRVNTEELPFFIGLMEHLALRGRNCPLPIRNREGEALFNLGGKYGLITSFLEGSSVKRNTNSQLDALGAELAQMHRAVAGFPMQRSNNLAPDRLRQLFDKVATRLDELQPGLRGDLQAELEILAQWPELDLPTGVIHADLFPDNVFFIGDTVTGFIDFYFACTDYLAYDLAICLNAWCFEQNKDFNVTKARALLQAYEHTRPLTPAERDTLPLLARGAAVRFMLTRAHDWFFPQAEGLVTPKDPMEYVMKWSLHRQVSSYREYTL